MRNAYMKSVITREDVVFYDTDSGGVVSNIAYLRYVEKARCALFESLGMDLVSIHEKQLFPTVVRTEIDYLKPAFPGARLAVEARLESVTRVRVNCVFTIYLDGSEVEDEKEIFAQATQMVALVQLPSGKPTRVPEEWGEC